MFFNWKYIRDIWILINHSMADKEWFGIFEKSTSNIRAIKKNTIRLLNGGRDLFSKNHHINSLKNINWLLNTSSSAQITQSYSRRLPALGLQIMTLAQVPGLAHRIHFFLCHPLSITHKFPQKMSAGLVQPFAQL